MINKVILVGNVGKAPETRSTTAGTPVATFSLATNRRWKDGNGDLQEQTEWHNLVAFGPRATTIAKLVTKGRQLYIEGRLQTRSWEDPTHGDTRYRTEILIENFQLLGPRPNNSHPSTDHAPEPSDDDIPF